MYTYKVDINSIINKKKRKEIDGKLSKQWVDKIEEYIWWKIKFKDRKYTTNQPSGIIKLTIKKISKLKEISPIT